MLSTLWGFLLIESATSSPLIFFLAISSTLRTFVVLAVITLLPSSPSFFSIYFSSNCARYILEFFCSPLDTFYKYRVSSSLRGFAESFSLVLFMRIKSISCLSLLFIFPLFLNFVPTTLAFRYIYRYKKIFNVFNRHFPRGQSFPVI